MKWTKIITAGLCVLAAVGASYGTVLYQQDFQSYAQSASNFVNSGNGWVGAGMGVNQTNTIGGVGSAFTSGAPVRSWYINDTATNVAGTQILTYSSTNSGAASISNNGNIKVSFDYVVRLNANTSAPTSTNQAYPTFDLKYGNQFGISLALMSASNSLNNYTGGAFQQIPGFSSVAISNWYRVEITIGDLSTAADTYDLKVWEAGWGVYNQPGTLVLDVAGLAFRTNVTYLDGMDFRTINGATKNCNYNIDNIQVESIPEPATMGMLGLGAVGLMVLRRHLVRR